MKPLRLLLLPLPLIHGACLQPLESPFVGDCASYPEGLYDYGDIGVGTCLAGPVDLKILPASADPDDYRLLVVNANPSLLFSSGSVLELSGKAIEEGITAGQSYLPVDQVAADALPVRSFSGPLAIDPDRDVAYYGNRLSFTTAVGADDRVEGLYLTGGLSAFTEFDEEAGDGTYALAGYDPFGTVRHDQSGNLYVVNIASHDVTILDTRAEKVRYARTPRDARLPEVTLNDTGLPSTLEIAQFTIEPTNLVGDHWTVTYIEPSHRLLYPTRWEGRGAVALADSADGVVWHADPSSPVLEGGEGDAWDRDGIGSVFASWVSEEDPTWLVWYEASGGGQTGIGFANTTSTWPGIFTKYDQGEEGPADDAVLRPGPDSYDSAGVGAPAVMVLAGDYTLYYNAVSAEGVHTIARATASNAIEWEKQGVALSGEGGQDVADPVVIYPYYQHWMYFVEGDLDSSTCVKIAVSDDGATFTRGGPTGGGTGCLLGVDQGLDPIVRQPAVGWDGSAFRMWISSSTSPEGPWRLSMARSFDGIRWEVVSDASLSEGGFTEDWSRGAPGVAVAPSASVLGEVRFEGELLGTMIAGATIGSTLSYGGLAFAVLEGHALPLPPTGKLWWGVDTAPQAGDDEVQLLDPFRLPGSDLLLVTARNGVAARIGTAQPREGEFIPDGSAYDLLGRDAAARVLPEDVGGVAVSDPWAVEQEGDIALFITREDSAGVTTLLRGTSQDGGESFSGWTQVLGPSEEESNVRSPSVAQDMGGLWHLLYTADVGGLSSIYHATSQDGVEFTRAASGELARGEPGSWDDGATADPSLWIDEQTGTFHLWYTGSDGSRQRVGYAVGTLDAQGALSWDKYRLESTGLTSAVLYPSSQVWDGGGVRDPYVIRDGELWRMWFEGSFDGTNSRVGYAESWDGVAWWRVYLPGTGGDTLTFATSPERIEEDPDVKTAATVQFDLEKYGTYAGLGSAAIAMTPPVDGISCYAVITTRLRSTVYVMDVHDDSAWLHGGVPGPCVKLEEGEEPDPDFIDSNYNRLEAIYLLKNTLSVRGTRSIAFSPDGETMYLTSSYPDALLIVDISGFEDNLILEATKELPLVGFIELPRADVRAGESISDDLENDVVTKSIGPTGVVLSPDGRWAYVGNGNDSSVHIIDLWRGAYGQIVAMANVGEVPSALTLSPDGRRLLVGNYVGHVEELVVQSTLSVVDVDPLSPSFGDVLTTVGNVEP